MTVDHVARIRARCSALDLPVADDELPALADLYGFYADGLSRIQELNRLHRAKIAPPPKPPDATPDLQPLADRSAPWLQRDIGASADAARSVHRQIAEGGTAENAFINPCPLPREASLSGPLSGATVAIKDNIAVAGVPLTFASQLNPTFVPHESAPLVEDLASAGAICVAKTNMGEFACSVNSSSYGPARNPWDLDHDPGGSSSGSAAAVAAGHVDVGIGTDAGGSVRIPASWCGLVGFRPTSGSLDIRSIEGVPWTIDNVGFMARKTATVREMLSHVDWRVHPPELQAARRVGVLLDESLGSYSSDVAEVYRQAVAALEDLPGLEVSEISLDGFDVAPYATIVVCYAEVGTYHRETIRARPGDYTPVVRQVMQMTQLFTAADYADARAAMLALRERYARKTEYLDAVITPTVPVVAPRLDEQAHVPGDDPISALFTVVRFTSLFNLTRNPTITIPVGLADGRLPVGLQIIGKHFRDPQLLELAREVEAATGFSAEPPAPTHREGARLG